MLLREQPDRWRPHTLLERRFSLQHYWEDVEGALPARPSSFAQPAPERATDKGNFMLLDHPHTAAHPSARLTPEGGALLDQPTSIAQPKPELEAGRNSPPSNLPSLSHPGAQRIPGWPSEAQMRRAVHGSWCVPFAVHFAGCQLCSGKLTDVNRSARCARAIKKVLAYTEGISTE
jgi:hypothetical protein